MTLELLPLFGVSLACIGLLSLFARYNKQAGWIKQRRTFTQDLLTLQALWNESDLAAIPENGNRISPLMPERLRGTPSPRETAQFSQQLGMLWTALDQKTVAPETVNQHVTA